MTTPRPASWFPLTGGDPCPGDPQAWETIEKFWVGRTEQIQAMIQTIKMHTSIDAEGKTFGRLENTFKDASVMLGLIVQEFSDAASTVKSWKDLLSQLQEDADTALKSAQEAQDSIEESQKKILELEAEAARDDSIDPIIYTKIHGVLGFGGLKSDIDQAEKVITESQKKIDEIRDTYSLKAKEHISSYRLESVLEIYSKFENWQLGNPFSSSDKVRNNLWDFDPALVSEAFSRAREDPANYPALLNLLSEMSDEELKHYFSTYQEDALFAVNPARGDSIKNAELVQKWWNAELTFDENGKYLASHDREAATYGKLSESQRNILMQYAPGFVGNMQGVAYSHRSIANINLLKMVSSNPQDRIGSPYEVKGDIAENIGDTAHRILTKQRSLEEKYKKIDIQIPTVEFSTIFGDEDSWDDIKIAASVGNLDRAENITYIVHGINTNPERSSDNHIEGAEALYVEVRYNGITDQAVVAWMNYEAPKGPPDTAVWSNEKAHEGGHRFAQDIDTLNTLRGGQDKIRVNVVGHSYGTDVVFSALTEMQTKADSASMLASAGIDKDQVEKVNNGELDLALEDNPFQPGSVNFYYSEAAKDGIYKWGRAPWSKGAPSDIEGSVPFTAETDPSGRYEDVDGHDLFIPEGEDKQGFLSRTTARRDLAYIVAGEENRITHESPVAWEYSPYGNFYYPAGMK